MKIGIIGAGNIGGTLARKLTDTGHTVLIANSRGPESLVELASETGASAAGVRDVVHGVDLVIISIPQKNVPSLPEGLFLDVPASVVVVDTGNYYPSFRDGCIEAIEKGMTESGWVAEKIGRNVVKVFNNITAQSLAESGCPPGTEGRIALPVAGDDEGAKSVVMQLVDEIGFDGVDAGTLDESWRQQPGTPVYATDWDKEGVKSALSMAVRERSAELRELALQKLQQLPQGFSHGDLIAALRSIN